MRLLVYFLLFFLLCFACRKEDPAVTPGGPNPIDTNTVFVSIYLPGDTLFGSAAAKKLSANWRASVIAKNSPNDPSLFSVLFLTYNSEGSEREYFGFSAIPKDDLNSYKLFDVLGNHIIQAGEVKTSYTTATSDGDVFEDRYLVDTLASDNNLTITLLDLPAKRVEGTFTVSFNIQEPRRNAANPKKVKFSSGKFWAVLPD